MKSGAESEEFFPLLLSTKIPLLKSTRHAAAPQLSFCAHCATLWVLSRIGVGGLQGCIQVSEVFRLKQVVSAGAQTVLEREPCKRPSSCPQRASPMRTASVNHTPAVPYHTLIHGSLSTPSTIPFLGNTQYNTNRPQSY